jgi:hypothetical protein
MRYFGILSLFATLLAPSLLAQQKTANTTSGRCSPIVINNPGHVIIRCSDLTKEQQDILANIPNLLNQVLAKQLTATQAKTLFKDMSDQLADIKNGVQQLQHNLTLYRNDTTSAVARVMRPPRSLGASRDALVAALKSFAPQEIAITPAHGSQEAIAYAEELKSAFTDAGWTVVRTQKFLFIIQDGIGLKLVTKPLDDVADGEPVPANDLTPGQLAVGRSFDYAGTVLNPFPMPKGDTGVTELYVGLQ